jgi:hypothetical protein
VLGFATMLAGDRASAEDIVQRTLIRAYQHWGKISSLYRAEFYLRKMVSICLFWKRFGVADLLPVLARPC